MLFGGLQKNSLIDYPGKISCVVFVSGCNFKCPYCHNPDLARGNLANNQKIEEEKVLDFLEQRIGLLDEPVGTLRGMIECAALLVELKNLLHATELGFSHPTTGRPMRFRWPPPEDFSLVVAELRKRLARALHPRRRV